MVYNKLLHFVGVTRDYGKGFRGEHFMTVINTLSSSIFNSDRRILNYWNSDLLQEIYFKPKVIPGQVQASVLRDPSFWEKTARLRGFTEKYEIESICDSFVRSFERDTGFPAGEQTLYLILGCGTTTIYSTSIGGQDCSVLCMEAIDGEMDRLKMLLAHEYTHLVRKQFLKKDIFESCVGERLITEGIAENYAEEIVPGKQDSVYCLVDEETVGWVQKNIQEIKLRVQSDLSGTALMRDLFYMYANIDYPVRCGYVYGYYVVKQYLKEHKLTVKDILSSDWRTILE